MNGGINLKIVQAFVFMIGVVGVMNSNKPYQEHVYSLVKEKVHENLTHLAFNSKDLKKILVSNSEEILEPLAPNDEGKADLIYLEDLKTQLYKLQQESNSYTQGFVVLDITPALKVVKNHQDRIFCQECRHFRIDHIVRNEEIIQE